MFFDIDNHYSSVGRVIEYCGGDGTDPRSASRSLMVVPHSVKTGRLIRRGTLIPCGQGYSIVLCF